MIKNKFIYLITLIMPCIVSSGCGQSNVFESMYKPSDTEKAKESLQNGNYDEAISILSQIVAADPSNYGARSMLANAYLGKAGINLLDLIVNLSNNADSEKNDLYAMLKTFPTGSDANINLVNQALTQLSAIPSDQLSENQHLTKVVANASIAFLTVSSTVLDSSGTIDTTKVTTLPTTTANTVYDSVVNIQTELIDMGTVAGNGSGLGKLLDLTNQVTSTGGATPQQKIETYLVNNK
jgi:hypothetical protein